ncbi:conserved Plasmodium protein, unknown function [Plasmodium sp. DRC-Itaito]|nr:conserved Plasmodium protein, unknown function [Plasmodium sp. DRC-Itaito]
MYKPNSTNNTTLSLLLYNDIVQYWIWYFLKDEKENKNHSIHLTSQQSLDLHNVKLYNNTFCGLAKFDNYSCPYFCPNIRIRNNNKKEYSGIFTKRELTGYGQIQSKHFLYKGYIYRGKKDKVGKYIFRNKNNSKLIYKGSWKNNKRHGYGKIRLYNNNKKKKKKNYLYKGYFKNNQRYFYGIQYYKDASYYVGFWKKNKKWGYGKMTWIKKKKKYQINNKINYNNFNDKKIKENQNIETSYMNNKVYSIQNEDNNLYNKKEYCFFVHSIYVGQWKNDKEEGYGKFFWFKKRKKKYINKNIVKSFEENINTYDYKDKYRNNIIYHNGSYDSYEGFWKKGKRFGYGIFNYYNGKKYIGMWKNNKKDGYGYLININNIINLCFYKQNKLIYEFSINKIYQINNLYTNTLCNVINLSYFKNYYNIKNKKLENLYKIIYENFSFLIDIYNFYKINNTMNINSTTYNQYIKKKKKGHSTYNKVYHNSFTLLNLWNMFFKSHIFDIDFSRHSLNNLVIDYLSYIDEGGKNYFFQQSEESTENFFFLFNEKDFIIKLFTRFDYLQNISTNKNEHGSEHESEHGSRHESEHGSRHESEHESEHGSRHESKHESKHESEHGSERLIHKDNITIMNTPNNFTIHNNTSKKSITYHTCKNKTHLCLCNNKIQSIYSRNYFCSLYQYFIFNMDLCLLKDCTNFYIYHWKHSFYKQANYFLLKDILFFIIKYNNVQKENIYFLYYVLCSMLITTIPLFYPFMDILYKYEKDKKKFKNNNIYKFLCFYMNYKQGNHNNIHFMSYMKKITDYLFLRKYSIHDEKRIITFNSFILTLVHIDIRIGYHKMCEHKNLHNLIQFLKEHSPWGKYKESDKQDIIQQIKTKKNFDFYTYRYIKKKNKNNNNNKNKKNYNNNKNKNKNKKNYNNNNNNKTSYHYKEMEIDGITYIINVKKKKNNKNERNIINKKNPTNVMKNNKINNIHIWNHFFPIYYDNTILYKFCPKKNKKNIKKTCKFCLKRIKFYLKNENIYDIELRNILENFVYYYILFFFIFKKKQKYISIFSMKLNVSIKLKNILKFLYDLNIMTKYNNNYNINCVNLCSLKKKYIYRKKIKYNDIYNNPAYNVIFQRDVHENNKNGKILSASLNIEDNNIIEIKKEQIILNHQGNKYHENINICHKNYEQHNKNDFKCEEINCFPIKPNENFDHNIYTIKRKHYTNTNYFKHKVTEKIQKMSNQFCLSFFEVLSIFSKILIPQRIHLIQEPFLEIYLKKLKKKRKLRKIQKHVLKNNILHYYMILKKEKDKYTNLYYKCTKNNICHNNKLVGNKLIYNTNKTTYSFIHQKIFFQKLINILNKKEKELFRHKTNEQHSTLQNKSQIVMKEIIPSTHDDISSIKKTKNKKKREKENNPVTNINNSNINKQINPNDIHNKETYNKLKTNNNLYTTLLYLPKNQYIKSPIYCFRKYVFSHKNYINILDLYNTYITPYEFITFFLKFVQKIKKKKKIQAPYNDVLFFFIFHVLIYKSFQLVKKKGKKKKKICC